MVKRSIGTAESETLWEVERMGISDAARFRGNANNSNCSPRNLNANNAVSNTNANNAGSAQVEPAIYSDQTTSEIVMPRRGEYYKTSCQSAYDLGLHRGGQYTERYVAHYLY